MAQITMTVDDSLITQLVDAFCEELKIPMEPVLDDYGIPTVDEDGIAIMKQSYDAVSWIKLFAMKQIAKKVTAGAVKLRLKASPIDETLMDSVIESNLN